MQSCAAGIAFWKLAGDAERRADILAPPDQERGDGDMRQQIGQVGLGHDGRLVPEGGGADVGGDGGEQGHEPRRWVAGEEAGGVGSKSWGGAASI